MKFGRFAALALGSLALVYCATTPEPGAEPPELPELDVTAAADQAAEIAEARRQARVAIASAADAGAETHDPVGLREARDALQEGDRLRTSDPEAAVAAMERARDRADRARRNSLGKARQQLGSDMDSLLLELRDHEADQFRPEEYSASAAEVGRVNELFAAGTLAEGTDAARDVIRQMEMLRDSLAAQKARVLKFKADTEALQDQLDAAAQVDAAKVAEMNERYAQGREALEQRYALADAERHFGAAREAGRAALAGVAAGTGAEGIRAQVETLLRTVMNDLESASGLMVITDDERVVDPAPWQGARFLSGEGAAAAALPARGETTVEQVPQHELLQRAKELWLQAAARRNAGDYRQAAAHLELAQRYHDEYVALAVMTTYTVRLIPERRESLWRIAEYDHIYGNPRLWPRIWHRNRKLIQDPHLIFPGWQLYIPPAQVSGEAPPAAQ